MRHRLPPDLQWFWGIYAPVFWVLLSAAAVVALGLFTLWCQCGPIRQGAADVLAP